MTAPAPASGITPAQLTQLLEVSRMFAVTTELQPLLHGIATACCEMLGCERSSIWLYDESRDELWTKVALGAQEIRVPAGTGIVGAAFRGNCVVHVPRPYEDPRFNPEPDKRSGFVTRSLLTAPMVDVDRAPLGVVQAVNRRGEGFSPAEITLIELLAAQAGVAVQRYKLQQAAIEGVALRKEMDLARDVQQAMIPKTCPVIDDVKAVGWTQPASITGGDAFDVWLTADNRLGIFLGDATGHGIAPALMVSQARTLVRTLCALEPDPTKLLERVNARLAEDFEAGKFVTAFIGFLSGDGELRWCSAGHGPVLVQPSADAEPRELQAPAPPLGILPDFIADQCGAEQLGPGGRLVVLSDGIIEAFAPDGEQFGTERVVELLRDRSASPNELLDRLKSAVEAWQGKSDPHDDQTVVIAARDR